MLCCKEVTPTKSKDKKDKTKSTGPKIRSRSAKLQLKGRIFMTNVTEVISFAKPGKPTSSLGVNTGALSNTFASQARTQSRFGVKGDPGVENFIIKFQNDDTMKKWALGLDTQRKDNVQQVNQSPDQPPPDFAWMRSQGGNLENPYAQQDDDDDDDFLPCSTRKFRASPSAQR